MSRRVTPILIALFALTALLFFPSAAFAAEGSDTGTFDKLLAEHGIGMALGGSFVAGIIASLTPCVFPMIPITVSIFGATETTSRLRGAALSGVYVLGICTLFTPLGVAAGATGVGMGEVMAKPYVIIPIALIFFALAASMFGAFELALPSSITNRVSTVGGVGFKGAFVLGLVLGLVAAPCTGPFLTALLLYIAKTKDLLLGGGAMFTFALGLGLPFFIAGTFALNLPKGGAWMMGIKWASGVVLAYMGFKYLRDRWPEVFRGWMSPSVILLAVGGVITAIGLGFGIVHIMAERRKSPIARLSKPMKLLSIVPAIAGMYITLSWFDVPKAIAGAMAWEKSEEAGIAKAKSEAKPTIVDFGASWCTACKELEHETWPDARVREEGKRFVAIAVDATDDEDKTVEALKKKYNVVGLPTVVLLDKDGKEQARFNEFVKPERMAEAMKKVQ
ncbi:MAG: thioredoxin fold domain-containing protein [Polyangiaceae bacterium]|nr:thioredoxin fold domain-containing protein [Polyangiaceae bacterium]